MCALLQIILLTQFCIFFGKQTDTDTFYFGDVANVVVVVIVGSVVTVNFSGTAGVCVCGRNCFRFLSCHLKLLYLVQ